MNSNYKAQSERTDEAERLLIPPFVKTKPTLASKISQLTPLMRECYNYAVENGDTLFRYPGGMWSKSGRIEGDKLFTTATIHELISRGFAAELDWKQTTNGRRVCTAVVIKKTRGS